MHKLLTTIVAASLLLAASFSVHASNAKDTEHQAMQYYNSVRNDPEEVLLFLQNMPKGGLLHEHLWGSAFPENMIAMGAHDDVCVNANDMSLSYNRMCQAALQLKNIEKNPDLYNKLINAWSMRNFVPGHESGHDHFFATFLKYYPLVIAHRPNMLAMNLNQLAKEHVDYIEYMLTTGNDKLSDLGKVSGWTNNFAQMRDKLIKAGFNDAITEIIHEINNDSNKTIQLLQCHANKPQPGCKVRVNYLYLAIRTQPPAEVFAQLLGAFEIAKRDPSVVGINLAGPEDDQYSMRDYDLQMQMIRYLHGLYPKVHISLHAGEFAPTTVPFAGQAFHIRDAVDIAGAQRIGHGVDIARETNNRQLLKELANKNIPLEINLTSNAEILGVTGNQHPLPLYLRHHVPVVLSTDDPGTLRTNITRDMQRAIMSYHLSYPLLKRIVRNSLTYSFMPGASLWQRQAGGKWTITSACLHDKLGTKTPSTQCQAFLAKSEKAKRQWQLEKEFKVFEASFS